MSSLEHWLAATPVPEREQRAWILERMAHSILRLSSDPLARALAAAALANDRDEQRQLARRPEVEGVPV